MKSYTDHVTRQMSFAYLWKDVLCIIKFSENRTKFLMRDL